jgi:K+-transporting ATPase ATPase C chain
MYSHNKGLEGMNAHLRANLWLLVLTVVLCCILYPLALWGIGQTFFRQQAQGSLLDAKGRPITDEKDETKAVGSRLIAQPFTDAQGNVADEYFQPRPSAASYNAAASACSNWAADNYLLRDRVARQLGPIVKYRSGPKTGQIVAPDVERWFQKDRFQGKPAIVDQWATLHSTVAQNWLHDWVKADKLNADYVADWEKAHAADVKKWKDDNPDNPEPKPEDLAAGVAGPFFASFSKDHPGTFPGAVEHKTNDGKTEKRIEPVKEGSDIQALFFDMWLTDHPGVDLEPVPGDAVTTSGSGLDPDITLDNARWQLDRVAGAWAEKTGLSRATVRKDIEELLGKMSHSPAGGLFGEPLVNVLEINLALRSRYQDHGR